MPKVWSKTIRKQLTDVTPHVLRHSFASTANDLGFTEATIAALLGHAAGTTTSRYVHNLDAALISAAQKVPGHIADLLRHADNERQGLQSLFERFGEATGSWGKAA